MTESAAPEPTPLPPPSPEKTRNRRIILGLIVLTLACYWPVGTFEFINYDDPKYLTDNEHVQDGLTWTSFKWSLTAYEVGYRHPLTWWSHLLDVSLFDMNAGGHHVTSMLLHVANTVLLWWALTRLTGAVWLSAWVAAMFGVHPTHLESVAWVSERKDVLSTLFVLLTIIAYCRYAEKPGVGRWLLVLAGFVAALQSKPMAVTTPCILLLLDVWPLRRIRLGAGFWSSLKWPVLEKLPLFGISLVAGMITIFDTQAAKTYYALEDWPLSVRLPTAIIGYARYIGKAFWPTNLSIFYPYPPDQRWPVAAIVGSAALFVLITGLVTWQTRRRPYLLVGWLLFVGTLLPVIGLVTVGDASLADRYTYLSFVGLFIVVGWLAKELAGRHQRLLAGIGIACVLACAVLSFRGVWHWRNSLTIMGHALAVTENNWTAHNNYAAALMEAERTDGLEEHIRAAYRARPRSILTRKNLARYLIDHGTLEEAREVLAPLYTSEPNDEVVLTIVGRYYAKAGRHDQALDYFDRALKLNPSMIEAMIGKAGSLLTINRIDEAETYLRRALAVKPKLTLAYHKLGLIEIARNNPTAALENFEQALAMQPELGIVNLDYGILVAKLARYDEALGALHVAVQHLRPDEHAHRSLAQTTIGIILERLNRPLEAAQHFIKAVDAARAGVEAKPSDPTTHYQLAMTLRKTGQFDAARSAAAKSMELAVKSNNLSTIGMLKSQFPDLPTTVPSTAPSTAPSSRPAP